MILRPAGVRHTRGVKTDRLYYTDCYLTEFRAQVVDSADSGTRVYLDKSAFYPSSGGQPNDWGALSGIAILDIVDEDDRVAHLVATPVVEREVEGVINWARRYDHMQQHTGQHLLSAVLVQLFGFPTLSFHMGDEVSAIELGAKELTGSQIAEAELHANEFVWQARPVTIRFEEGDATGLRKVSQRSGLLRIIEIEGLDRSACGGTHVRSTAEVGPIQIRRAEKIRGNTRIDFLCGLRALKRSRQDFRVVQELARQSATAIDDLPSHAMSIRQRLAQAEKTNERFQSELARRDGFALYESTPPDAGGVRRAMLRVPVIDAAVRAQAQAFASREKAVLLAVGTQPAGLLLVCSADSAVNAKELVEEIVLSAGGRGGGSSTIAQSSLPNSELADQLARAAGFEV